MSSVIDISAQELHDKLLSGDVALLDVRTEFENAQGHIEGDRIVSLEGITPDELQRQIELVSSPGIQVVLYCESGSRSTLACTLLHSMGFTDVRVLSGGLVAWEQAGFPTVTA